MANKRAVKSTEKEIADNIVETAAEETAAKTAKSSKTAKTAKAPKASAEAIDGEEKKPAAPKKKAAPKKTKKTAEEMRRETEEVYFQFYGQEILANDIFAKAKEAYMAEGNQESMIESFKLYIKPEDNKAYYIVNDETRGHICLD
ncbi:DUF6465 family protein [Anaerobium acetethylicum]|uniref:Uncharacterized protein n=1 Tax=Anaerobium acetethylicum TaxID=1619234 RepID=A0A1D3TTC9_9FIRM|nr:DUF6465 family protein [Anaerobium acetethylicum]SCP97193.1 hypothetical protein SAMN05421730_100919 [Anaerobium acetethylicum]